MAIVTLLAECFQFSCIGHKTFINLRWFWPFFVVGDITEFDILVMLYGKNNLVWFLVVFLYNYVFCSDNIFLKYGCVCF